MDKCSLTYLNKNKNNLKIENSCKNGKSMNSSIGIYKIHSEEVKDQTANFREV